MKILAVIALALALTACKPAVTHPGAINTFDSETYDVLIGTKAVIDQTKTDLVNNVFPATVAAKVKTVVNTGLVPAYNALDVAYTAYHTAADPSAPTATVQAAINNVQTQTANLTAAKAGN